jgi:hypothetical protein
MNDKERYLKEKALAKLVALFEAQERVAALYVEIVHDYPEAAAMIDAHDPSLLALRQEAERRWIERTPAE